MRILIYSLNFSPELTSTGKYSGEMASWLAERGHEVRAVASPPYYPQWKISSDYSAWKYQIERSAQSRARPEGTPKQTGLEVWRCPIWVPKRPGGIIRLFHLASFAISSLPITLLQTFWKPDVVLVVEPPLFNAPGAWLTARLCGAAAWLHIQDFEVDAAFALGLLPPGILQSWVRWFEAFLMQRFDRVSTISPRMLDLLLSKGVAEHRTSLFPNWVDAKSIYPLSQVSSLRRELAIPDEQIVALYSGNLGKKQGLEIVVEAAAHLQEEPKLTFVICGEGPLRAELESSARNLKNVRFQPLQPSERLNDLLNVADMHLLPQKAEASDLVMPSKLTGMLASGRPIIATADANTQVGAIVSKVGVIVPPGDAKAMAEAIRRMALDADLRKRCGQKAREIAVTEMGRDQVLQDFERGLVQVRNDGHEGL